MIARLLTAALPAVLLFWLLFLSSCTGTPAIATQTTDPIRTETAARETQSPPGPSESGTEPTQPVTTTAPTQPVPTAAPTQPIPTEPPVTVTFLGRPVRSLYAAGERFDPTGLYAEITEGGRTYRCAVTASDAPLTEGQSLATVSAGGAEYAVPITVCGGQAAVFTSSYSGTALAAALDKLEESSHAKTLAVPDTGSFLPAVLLPDPCPDGIVHTRDELIALVDTCAFYGMESVVARLVYLMPEGLENELDLLYKNSRFLPGISAVKGIDLGGGYVQILLRFYPCDLAAENKTLPAAVISPFRKSSSRSSFLSPRIREDGVDVFTSDQAVYALLAGHDIHPAPGSPAEAAVKRACEILAAYCDDDWTATEKLYNIYLYFTDNVVYDQAGEGQAGASPDRMLEPYALAAHLVSFYAEGPLFYGNAACFGYAKACALLLALEGFEVTRITAQDLSVTGRSATIPGDSSIHTHSYLYVTVDGADYLVDPTYAYAGEIAFQADRVCWFRDFCLTESIYEHQQVYGSYETDWYAASDRYRIPSSGYLGGLTWGDGQSAVLRSQDELDAYLNELTLRLKASPAKYCTMTLMLSQKAFSYSEATRLAVTFCSKFGTQYARSAETRRFLGEDCYCVLMVISK